MFPLSRVLFDKRISFLLLLLVFLAASSRAQKRDAPFVIVLGVAQDAGYPQAGCEELCCRTVWSNTSMRRSVVSIALADPSTRRWWLFDASPDLTEQLQRFRSITHGEYPVTPQGIFLTHAHIGHYTGLMQLGREAMNTSAVPVYALPRMQSFLMQNGPWSQLVTLKNISMQPLDTVNAVRLTDNISVETFTVPHRDEFSETAGFIIRTNRASYLYLPDIDKWKRWHRSILEMVDRVDFAFLDGTFFKDGELKNRAMSEVPHPFVSETVSLFSHSSPAVKSKIHFIHFNHTNPLLRDSAAVRAVRDEGFSCAVQGSIY